MGFVCLVAFALSGYSQTTTHARPTHKPVFKDNPSENDQKSKPVEVETTISSTSSTSATRPTHIKREGLRSSNDIETNEPGADISSEKEYAAVPTFSNSTRVSMRPVKPYRESLKEGSKGGSESNSETDKVSKQKKRKRKRRK